MKRRIPMRFVTNPGSRIHVQYQARFDGQKLELFKTGEVDIQKEIESYGRYTDLHYMLHRLKVGDNSVLCSSHPMYGDFSGLPSNPVDVINFIHGAEAAFGTLSSEDRSLYNNDFRSWLADRISGRPPRKSSDSNRSVTSKPDVKKEGVSNES